MEYIEETTINRVNELVERLNEGSPDWQKMIWDQCGLDIDIEDENGNLSAEWTLSSEYGDCTIDWTYDDPDDYDCLKLLIDTINDCTWCDMDEIADTPFGAFHRSDIEPRLETMISSLHYVYADGTVMQFTYDGLCGCDVQVGNEEDDFSMIEIRADKDTTLDEVVDDVEKQIREYVEGCFDLKGANE